MAELCSQDSQLCRKMSLFHAQAEGESSKPHLRVAVVYNYGHCYFTFLSILLVRSGNTTQMAAVRGTEQFFKREGQASNM